MRIRKSFYHLLIWVFLCGVKEAAYSQPVPAWHHKYSVYFNSPMQGDLAAEGDTAVRIMSYSFLFDWCYLRQEIRRRTPSPYIANPSKEVHQYLCRFLSTCGIYYREYSLAPKLPLPYASPQARQYFVKRLSRMWVIASTPSSMASGFFRPYDWRALYASHTEQKKIALIHEFEQFHTLFPKDRYLSAYAEMCSAVLGIEKEKVTLEDAQAFTRIELKYPDFPEIGIMCSWWKGISLCGDNFPEASKAFNHLANKYSTHRWWVVHTAKQARTRTLAGWKKLGLLLPYKPKLR